MKASRCIEIVAATLLGQVLVGGLLAQTPRMDRQAVETLEEMEFDVACNAVVAKMEDVKTPEAKTTPPQVNPKWPLSTPEYPPRSRRMNEEGTVFLSFLVTEQGLVAKARVSKSSGWAHLDHAALKETGYWRFIPARIVNAAACMWISTPIVFSLSDADDLPVSDPARVQS